MIDQLSFDFAAPPEIIGASISEGSESLATPASHATPPDAPDPIPEPAPVAAIPTEAPMPVAEPGEAPPSSPPPWPKAPDWTARLTRPIGDDRPHTLLG